MKKQAIIGGVISVFFLILALYKVDYAQLWGVIRDAKWSWMTANIGIIVIAMVLRAWRWQFILRTLGTFPYQRVYSATMIGFMANNVLPARLGEVARAVSLAARSNHSRSALLGTIIVERVYDSFTLLLFLWLVFTFSRIGDLPDVGRIRHIGWVFLAINAGLVAFLVTLQKKNDVALRILGFCLRPLPERWRKGTLGIVERFARGLTLFHDFRTVTMISVLSVALWALMGVSNYFVFLSLGFSGLPLETSFVVLVVVSLFISIPSTAGFVGVYHWACQISLQLYELSKTEAVAVAVVMHAAQYLVITALGFYYLKRDHLQLRDMRKVDESDPEP